MNSGRDNTIMRRLENKINEVMSGDISALSIDDLVNSIMPLTGGMVLVSALLKEEERMYRVRKLDHTNLVSDLSYPPAENAIEGRVNRAGSPMFYASNNRYAAIAETEPKPGDILLVSSWKVIEPLELSHIGYHPETLKSIGSSKEHIERLKNGNLFNANVSRDEFSVMARLFIGKNHKHKYKLSTAIAECMLKGPFHGLVYPSIAMKGHADNFAILPNHSDKNIMFAWVEKFRLKSINEDVFEIDTIDYATSQDGIRLQWKGRGPAYMRNDKDIAWEMRVNKITKERIATPILVDIDLIGKEENGQWIFRNKEGKIIDPV